MRPPQRTAPFREAEIDMTRLEGNVARFRARTGGKPLFADVGANAWGHGLAVVVPALAELGAEGFVVARLDEAERVRELAPEAEIITTQHAADESFDRAAALGVAPAVRSHSEFDRAVAAGVRAIMLVPDDGAGVPALNAEQWGAAATEAGSKAVVMIRLDTVALAGPELLGVSEDDDSAEASGYRPVLRLWAPIAATNRVGAEEGVS